MYMYVRMRVCMYVHVHVCIHTYICEYMYSKDVNVSVSLRVMGALLSSYLLTQSPHHHSTTSLLHPSPPLYPVFSPDDPTPDRLLELAHNLAIRLLPAFEDTATGIPHPRVGPEGFP